MMKAGWKEALTINHVGLRNEAKFKGKKITGVATDSRTVGSGELFFALRGENFDAHAFLGEVRTRGAIAAVVEESADCSSASDLPLIVVKDSTLALGEFARHYRMKFDIPVIAVAGSNGKTTTKDMIAAVLGKKYRVLSTQGNLNNHIGVPLTLFRLERRHQVAVVEIGTNHPGEIEYLCEILQPTHGLVTNIGREHLEFFETLDGVAREEGALFDFLARQKKSTAIVNADDKRIGKKAQSVEKRFLYGCSADAVNMRGTVVDTEDGCALTLTPIGGRNKQRIDVKISVPGTHNGLNALAAAAVGMAMKVSARQIRSALEGFRPSNKRMEVLNFGSVKVLNDTYNANPDSMVAALQTLASLPTTGKRIAVLADMRELGSTSAAEHARIGKLVTDLKIEYLLTFGEEAKHISNTAEIPLALHYDQKNVLAEYLAELVSEGDLVLVKGSRGMRMEDVVTFLQERLRMNENHIS